MMSYDDVIMQLHKDVVCATQASILANIYASLCVTPEKAKPFSILKAAVERNDECAITLEPLTYSSVVTACSHVFSKEGLLTWNRSSLKRMFDCPLCKQHTKIIFP